MKNSAVIIRVDGSHEVLGHQPTLEEAQSIVGGYIELVKVKVNGRRTLIVDEDGKPKHKPSNIEITRLYGGQISDGYIVGDVIVLTGWRTVK